MNLNWLTTSLPWIKSIWSEADGNGSSTRIHISAILTFVLGVGVSFAWLVHREKMTLEQYSSFLGAASGFIVTTVTPMYATNKAADWLKNKDNQSNQTNSNTTGQQP